MCGIWIYFGNPHPEDSIFDVAHRGPDSKGQQTLSCAHGVVEFAHWRLSIVDLSPAGAQPMSYMGDRYLIVFNGEVYNYRELRAELEQQGYSFRSDCDTEVIMAAYDCWGVKCLDRFLGMFAFGLWDTRTETLFLARDRFGIKPLYYYESERGIAFASEIKQFTGLKAFQPKANPQRVTDYLIYGAQDHTSETLFEGVHQLRGGEYALVSCKEWRPGKSIAPKSWYHLRTPATFQGTFEEALETYQSLFFDIIRLHLRSDVTVGSCLSGGMDSSSIVCTAHQLLTKAGNLNRQNTYSCCFTEPECDESLFMEAVEAATEATPHHIFPTLDQALKLLPKLVWHQDEPLANASIFGQYELFRNAKSDNVLVMLDGQGGDEQLASYPQFFGLHLLNQFLTTNFENTAAEARALKKFHGWKVSHSLRALLFWFAPSWGIEPSAIRKKLLSEPHWLSPQYVRKNHIRFSAPWHFDGKESPSLNVPWLSRLMLSKSTIPMLLHWEDRNSMANSVEARVPFLDHRLVEFTLSLPNEFKTYRGSTKRVLKAAMAGIVPQTVINRMDKKGFATPEEQWFRNPKESSFRDQVLQTARDFPELFSEEGLSREINAVMNHQKPFTHVFWRIFSFGIWIQTFGVKI
ncbi:MAG: asparagine synthase (glutamine-hydrolyzing) [Chthoniobacterales bacterium]